MTNDDLTYVTAEIKPKKGALLLWSGKGEVVLSKKMQKVWKRLQKNVWVRKDES